MLCPHCDIEMVVSKTDLIINGIKILENVDASICNTCGEKVFDSDVAVRAFEKSRNQGTFGLGSVATRKITQVGNSLAITIPKDFIKILQIEKGNNATIEISGKKRITITID